MLKKSVLIGHQAYPLIWLLDPCLLNSHLYVDLLYKNQFNISVIVLFQTNSHENSFENLKFIYFEYEFDHIIFWVLKIVDYYGIYCLYYWKFKHVHGTVWPCINVSLYFMKVYAK